ncbi:trimeric intracellular cation channel family protein [Lacipirellula sp.]|uniref:trimeric intracellular cation channel family protein n=1 Tax=Lacipirellula sp. TaxID=2691419 RepID=UPI003D10B272
MYPVIEVTAVAALAMYGVLRGARKDFDLVGICYIAFAVAFGGGTLRDLLLDRHPIFWIENDHLAWIVMAIAVSGAFLPKLIARLEPILWIPDALGLGLFSILGAVYAIDCGTGRFVAILMGVITGSCGGVIADVICNDLPSVFQRSPLYATCSFLGALSYVALHALGVDSSAAMAIGVTVVVAIRIGAVRWNWQLPPHTRPGEPPG